MAGIKEYKPPNVSDKRMRLHAQTAVFEAGRVLLPVAAPWLEEYVREITGFPGTKFDDQVDATTQALEYFGRYCSLAIWEALAA